ncbi:MAG TPA: T9SS type A sorting domain-containing protein [Ignavibacteria bacterium]
MFKKSKIFLFLVLIFQFVNTEISLPQNKKFIISGDGIYVPGIWTGSGAITDDYWCKLQNLGLTDVCNSWRHSDHSECSVNEWVDYIRKAKEKGFTARLDRYWQNTPIIQRIVRRALKYELHFENTNDFDINSNYVNLSNDINATSDPTEGGNYNCITSKSIAGEMITGSKQTNHPVYAIMTDSVVYQTSIRMKLNNIPIDIKPILEIDKIVNGNHHRDTIYSNVFHNNNFHLLKLSRFLKNDVGIYCVDTLTHNSKEDLHMLHKNPLDIKIKLLGNYSVVLDYISFDTDTSIELFEGKFTNSIRSEITPFCNEDNYNGYKIADELWDRGQFRAVGFIQDQLDSVCGNNKGLGFCIANVSWESMFSAYPNYNKMKRFINETKQKRIIVDIYPFSIKFKTPPCKALMQEENGQQNPFYEISIQNCLKYHTINGLDRAIHALDSINISQNKYYPLWLLPQVDGWPNDSLREPYNNEIKAQINIGLAFGVQGIDYFYVASHGNDYVGLINDDKTERTNNGFEVPGNKWECVQRINKRLKGIVGYTLANKRRNSTLSNYSNVVSADTLFSPKLLCNSMIIQDIKSSTTSDFSSMDSQEQTYVTIGDFKNESGSDSDSSFIYVVNRRCHNTLGKRYIKIFFNNFGNNNAIVKNIETNETFIVNNSKNYFYDEFEPGEGKLFKITKNIVSDTNIIKNNIIIPAGTAVTITAGSILKFSSGLNITCYGVLSAQGTTEGKITFTSLNTNEFWGGITFVGTGASNSIIQNCKIERVNNNGSAVNVINAGNGITISYSDISNLGNVNNAIYVNNSYIYVFKNKFENNYSAIRCFNIATAECGSSGIFNNIDNGNNKISLNLVGISAEYNSTIYMELGQPNGAYNSINNSSINAFASNNSIIWASGNYWGSSIPNPNYFYNDGSSYIDYSLYLSSSPLFNFSKNEINNYDISETVSFKKNNTYSTLESKDKLKEAKYYFDNGLYNEAFLIYKDLINNNNKLINIQANNGLLNIFRLIKDKSILELLNIRNCKDNLFIPFIKIYNSNALLSINEFDEAIKLNYEVSKQYPSSIFEKTALIQNAYISYYNLKDTETTNKIIEYLKEHYSDDEDVKELSSLILNDNTKYNNDYIIKFKKDNLFNKNNSNESNCEITNYPNPFNPTTVIKYSLPKSTKVKIIIYDIMGREVKTLVDEYKLAGSYSVFFDGTNLSSGTYYYKFVTSDYIKINKMLLIK